MANLPNLYVALEWHSGYPVINIERGRVASIKVKPREAAKLANDIIDALEQSEQESTNDR